MDPPMEPSPEEAGLIPHCSPHGYSRLLACAQFLGNGVGWSGTARDSSQWRVSTAHDFEEGIAGVVRLVGDLGHQY